MFCLPAPGPCATFIPRGSSHSLHPRARLHCKQLGTQAGWDTALQAGLTPTAPCFKQVWDKMNSRFVSNRAWPWSSVQECKMHMPNTGWEINSLTTPIFSAFLWIKPSETEKSREKILACTPLNIALPYPLVMRSSGRRGVYWMCPNSPS